MLLLLLLRYCLARGTYLQDDVDGLPRVVQVLLHVGDHAGGALARAATRVDLLQAYMDAWAQDMGMRTWAQDMGIRTEKTQCAYSGGEEPQRQLHVPPVHAMPLLHATARK